MKTLSGLIFLSLFFIIQAQASNDHASAVDEHKAEPVKPIKKREVFKPIFEVLSGERSLISKKLLLSGEHWVKKTNIYKLQTPYGEIISSQGDFYVKLERTKVSVTNHLGDLKVTLRDGRTIQVPAGFEFWFSELQQDKKNLMGFIQPLDLKEHVLTLGKLWPRNSEDFKDEMLRFQNRWGDRAGLASDYYKGLAQRKIASIQSEENRLHNLKQRQQSQRAAQKKYFFERTFGR